MAERANVKVTRGKDGILPSTGPRRRQSVPTGPSTRVPQVVKLLDRSHHQSFKTQNVHSSEKVRVRRVSIIHKSLPPPSTNHSTYQNPINANDTLQSVSFLILDANDTNKLEQTPITNHSGVKPSINVQNDNPHWTPLSQPRQNKCDDLIKHSANAFQNINIPEAQDHKGSSSINIRPIPNSQNMIITHLNDIERWPSLKDSTQKHRNKKRGYFKCCGACSPLCSLLSMIGLIILAAIIAGIVIALLPSRKTATTTITSTTTTTTTTTSVSTTSTSTTSTTTTTTTVTTTTSKTTTTATTTLLCSPSCSSQQSCVEAVCLNVGYLGCALTWSRPGDGDIVVTTPNRRTISYLNRGPSNTDGGILDRDDQSNTGPENVYWPTTGAVPPTGTYYICFEPYSISPTINTNNPITVVYRIILQSGAITVFTRTFTSVLKNSYSCDSTSITLVGSFTYP